MPEPTEPNASVSTGQRPRVLLLTNRSKPRVVEALESFLPWLQERATVLGPTDTCDTEAVAAEGQLMGSSPAELAIVMGGDGTLLSQAALLAERDVPILGINFGKLGFLAEFSVEQVQQHWDMLIAGQCRESARLLMQIDVFPHGTPVWGGAGINATPGNGTEPTDLPEPVYTGLAMNDAVINAGPPFRMLELELAIEPRWGHTSATIFHGDGVVIATPSGSTAYNLSAGGPIISPGVDALAVTALNPQSLAFRPIVYSAQCETWILVHQCNRGTTLVLDGRLTTTLEQGQQVRVLKHGKAIRLIHNPELSYWNMLATKMHWAARPRRRS